MALKRTLISLLDGHGGIACNNKKKAEMLKKSVMHLRIKTDDVF